MEVLPETETVTVFPGPLDGVLTPIADADSVLYVPIVDLAGAYSGSTFLPDLGGGSGALVALDADSGDTLWTATLPAPSYGAATVLNELVLTSDANGRVYAFARESGLEVWHYDAPGRISAPLAAASDMLLIAVGVGASELFALQLP